MGQSPENEASSHWYSSLKSTGQKSDKYTSGSTLEVKVVGVTYEGRQAIVAQLTEGEQLWLKREPDNPYDTNAIRVDRTNGQQVGYLSRELAAKLARQFDTYQKPVSALVTALTGGFSADSSLGVCIRFEVPNILSVKDEDNFEDYY